MLLGGRHGDALARQVHGMKRSRGLPQRLLVLLLLLVLLASSAGREHMDSQDPAAICLLCGTALPCRARLLDGSNGDDGGPLAAAQGACERLSFDWGKPQQQHERARARCLTPALCPAKQRRSADCAAPHQPEGTNERRAQDTHTQTWSTLQDDDRGERSCHWLCGGQDHNHQAYVVRAEQLSLGAWVRWTQVDGLGPGPRGGHACVTVGHKVLLFGGSDRVPVTFDDLWVLETGALRCSRGRREAGGKRDAPRSRRRSPSMARWHLARRRRAVGAAVDPHHARLFRRVRAGPLRTLCLTSSNTPSCDRGSGGRAARVWRRCWKPWQHTRMKMRCFHSKTNRSQVQGDAEVGRVAHGHRHAGLPLWRTGECLSLLTHLVPRRLRCVADFSTSRSSCHSRCAIPMC